MPKRQSEACLPRSTSELHTKVSGVDIWVLQTLRALHTSLGVDQMLGMSQDLVSGGQPGLLIGKSKATKTGWIPTQPAFFESEEER